MNPYQAPVKDMLFVLEHLADLGAIAAQPGFEDAGLDTAAAVLEECARFTQDVVAPLNHGADRDPGDWNDGRVRTAPGFKQAFAQYVAGGWQGLQHPAAYGGQGLPKTIAAACNEMLNAASLSFALCPLLTDGAIETLLVAGSDAQQARWIPELIEGRATGTMNLTEPQAGSDLAQVRSRAEPQADGSYRVFGQKIFITYGEHDYTDDILHLVLARLPDAPAGVKGLSLFAVPRRLADGRRNDVWCASLEHKLGIKASPTAVLLYGDDHGDVGPGAIGELLGAPNRGLETMFIMMNAARFAVGVQGVAVAQRAWQQALDYARDRVQSRPVDGSAAQPVAIVEHPDVRRMLLTMKALTEGARALALVAASAHDRGDQAVYEFLVPIVKGFATEMAQEVATLGVQVHGGMGYIEETGAAQHLRDARILTIYEGTTAIQANDLVGRKTLRDGGAAALALLQQVAATEAELAAAGAAGQRLAAQLGAARADVDAAVRRLVAETDPNRVYGAAVPYLMLWGTALAGWQLARAWLATDRLPASERSFAAAKRATAVFYAEQLLVRTGALRAAATDGSACLMALPAADL